MNVENNGLVSIIMPSYNASKYIKDSIESVLSQTYPYWELLIIDDCSTDNTVEVINSFNDKRIKVIKNDVNSGAAISRNKGLETAKGKWIAFLDADDIWLPNKLEEQLNFMIDNNYVFSYTDYRIRFNDEFDNYIRTAPKYLNWRRIKKYCYCFTSTVIYNSEVIGLIQITDMKKNNDYAMWLHALRHHIGYRYPKCLSYYVKHGESISSGSKFKLIKWHYRLFRQECKYNKIHAFILTIGNLWHGFWKKVIYKKKIEN